MFIPHWFVFIGSTTVGNDPLQECVNKYLQGTHTISLSNKKGWKDPLLRSEVTILAMQGFLTFASEVFSWEIPAGIRANSNHQWWVIAGLSLPNRWEKIMREYITEGELRRKIPPAIKTCRSLRERESEGMQCGTGDQIIPVSQQAARLHTQVLASTYLMEVWIVTHSSAMRQER